MEMLLDRVWHYDCVVSPRSCNNSLPNLPVLPCIDSPYQNLHEVAGRPAVPPLVFLQPCCTRDGVSNGTRNPARDRIQDGARNLNRPRHPDTCNSKLNTSSKTTDVRRINNVTNEKILVFGADNTKSVPTVLDADRLWLQRVFETFDENGDGLITKDELSRSLQKLGVYMAEDSISSLLSSVGALQMDAYIDIDVFQLLYNSACRLIDDFHEDCEVDEEEELLQAFKVFDKDNDGFISATELQSVLRCLGFPQAKNDAACLEMIQQADKDGDGQVNFPEFKGMLSASVRC